MPVAPTYPGVYIEEVPSGVRTIVGVATSIAAFVDRFERGPLNRAIRITSYADFERDFGGLNADSEASYAIQQFFLNGGTEAHVVRVGIDPAHPSLTPYATAAVTLTEAAGGTNVVTATAGRQVRGVSVEDPGVWGNFLRLDVDHATANPDERIDPDGVMSRDEMFNLTISEIEVRGGRTIVLRSETYRNLTMRPNMRTNALAVVNESSGLVQLSAADTLSTPPERPDATGLVGTRLTAPPAGTLVGIHTFDIDYDLGTGVVNVPTSIDFGATAPTTFLEARRILEAAIRAADPNEPLLARAQVLFQDDRMRVLLGRTGTRFNPAATITLTDTGSGTTMADLGLHAIGGGAQQYALVNGADGAAPDAITFRGSEADRTGIWALEDVDLFNILCIPAAAELTPDTDMRSVYAEATSYCERRRAFLIVDIPATTVDLDDMEGWLADNDSLRSDHAAVYFPCVRISDPLAQGRLRSVGASGTMAGLYARTDGERGVWKAPAGTDARLRNVQELVFELTDDQNGVINPLGVNALRRFPIYGHIAWGARTLDGADAIASEWKYVPVRRLALFLEESLFRGTKWVVFEPNDEPLWAQIRLNVSAFMHDLFRQGAFQGTTPRDAYFVKCDKETTTQTDINKGIVNILVGFAPLKPAEFVMIKIQQIAGQIQT